jgi:ArsR family metal-binding transcriptional regulator
MEEPAPVGLEDPPARTAIVFPGSGEFRKARLLLDSLGLHYGIVSPEPAYALVGAPVLISDLRGLAAVHDASSEITCAGWVNYRPARLPVPQEPPRRFDPDVFGRAAVMFIGPCMADENRVRLIAHIGGDLTEVLPYLNTAMPQACFNPSSPSVTFMEEQRLITVYPWKVMIGKAEGLVDGWRALESVRTLVNCVWAGRASIAPSYKARSKPPVLELYRLLPQMNCKACGDATCMAFAARLWNGTAAPSGCPPLYSREYSNLRGPLVELCSSYGVFEHGGPG